MRYIFQRYDNVSVFKCMLITKVELKSKEVSYYKVSFRYSCEN